MKTSILTLIPHPSSLIPWRRRVAALLRKEFLQILRDPSTFLIAGVLPLLPVLPPAHAEKKPPAGAEKPPVAPLADEPEPTEYDQGAINLVGGADEVFSVTVSSPCSRRDAFFFSESCSFSIAGCAKITCV